MIIVLSATTDCKKKRLRFWVVLYRHFGAANVCMSIPDSLQICSSIEMTRAWMQVERHASYS